MAEADSLPLSHKECLKNKMISRLVKTDAHFRHQQRGEPDLTQEEKSSIAVDILNKNSALFLERFSKYLSLEDVDYFEDQKDDYQIGFYIEEISKRSSSRNLNVVKNRRFRAMQKLMDEGEYFSEDEMKWRDPLLYEQMVGQYTSEAEKMDKAEQDIDRSDLRFSTILLKHLDMQANKQFYEQLKEREEEQEEEEDDDSDEEEEESSDDDIPVDTDMRDGSGNKQDHPGTKSERENRDTDDVSEVERSYFRGEFLRIMQEKFLSGEDTNFDYSKVDSNADYDSLDIVGHDAEEKYFDADEGSNEGYSFSASSPEREKWMSSSMEEEEEDKSKPESIEESKV